MANLLDKRRLEWAAAVIEVLSDSRNKKVVDRICSTNAKRYYNKLVTLTTGLPRSFPLLEKDELLIKMRGCINPAKSEPNIDSPQSEGEDISIGESATDLKRQQRVHLGINSEGHNVYCFLDGP